MNNAATINKNSILLYGNIVEIHHRGTIWRSYEYDGIERCVMNYLHYEGFLETVDLLHPENLGEPYHIADIQMFDDTGKVRREQLI